MTDRELSCFFVRELFPLYAEEGALDKQRRALVTKHLSTCKECKTYYEKLTAAKTKVSVLVGTKVSHSMIDYLKQEHHFWNELIKRVGWKSWPVTAKWAVELSAVTTILIFSIHYFPWVKAVRMAKKMRPRPPVEVAMDAPQPLEQPTTVAKSEPREALQQPQPTQAQAVTQIPAMQSQPQAQPTAAATPVEAAKVAQNLASSEVEADEAEDQNAETAGVLPDPNEQKSAGFVWRGSLKVEELTDEVTARVTKTIVDLGGTKAGQVELGWKRGGKQRYYHFILPEENYEKLLSVLNTEGIVQLTKERHPRMIKPGHMRIIMTVDESGESE